MPIISIEYRSVINVLFCFKRKSREYILNKFKEGYGDEFPTEATIYRWYNEYRNGRTTVEDSNRSEKLAEIGEELSSKVVEMIIS